MDNNDDGFKENVEALNHLVDEVKDAGWHVSLEGKTINIH